MLDPHLVNEIQFSLGKKFTLDAACNDSGDNSHVPEHFCSPARSFLDSECRGQFVFMNPPFSQMEEFILHYCQEKSQDPSHTSAVIVVPVWRGAEFNKYLKGMHLLKQCPKGSRIFWAKDAISGERRLMPGIPWAVNIWYDPPKMRPRPASRLLLTKVKNVELGAHRCDTPLDISGVEPQYAERQTIRAVRMLQTQHETAFRGEPRAFGSARECLRTQSPEAEFGAHHTRSISQALAGKNQQARYSMQVVGNFQGAPCRVLFDTGALDAPGFISTRLVEKLQMKSSVKPTGSQEVFAFDGNYSLKSSGILEGRLRMSGVREKVNLHVLDLDDTFDIILGEQYMSTHNCSLCYSEGRILIDSGGKRYSVPTLCTGTDGIPSSCGGFGSGNTKSVAPDIHRLNPARFLRIAQVKRALRTRRKVYFVQVRAGKPDWHNAHDGQADRSPTQGPGHDWYPEQPESEPTVGGADVIERSVIDRLVHRFGDVFQDLPPGSPRERPVAHSIPLVEGAQPFFRRSYRLSPDERAVVQEYVQKLLVNGWIRPSTSPWGAPILLVPKPDGTMRVCVDYRGLNALTVKNRYALPRVDDLLDSLSGAKVFTALDLASGYWQIKISEEDSVKTGFNTHEGHYEWKVLPMGLSNAPATFQHMMNTIFAGKGLGKFVAVYLDDILIYSKSPEEHLQHLEQVFEVLREHSFYCKPSKCHFAKSELKYLGHIVGVDGIKVDPAKIAKVAEWPVPKSVGEVRSFVGLATYFRRFIQGFSTIARPLHALTKHGVAQLSTFPWTASCQAAFEGLKAALTTAPVLRLPNYDKPFEVIADASVHGLGAVLMQDGHPVAYESRKFSPAEYNYDTGEQEMLAVVHALKAFRCYVGSSTFTLVTDHEPLTYFNDQPQISRKHARWYEFLQMFSFQWEHRPGRINVADPLSRMPHQGQISGGFRLSTLHRHVLFATTRRTARAQGDTADLCSERVAAAKEVVEGSERVAANLQQSLVQVSPEVSERVAAGLQGAPVGSAHDAFLSTVRDAYADDPSYADESFVSANELTRESDLWWRGQALAVPNANNLHAQCLSNCHDSQFGGHFGVAKTRKLACRLYWWPGIRKDVEHHVQHCLTCQRNKAPNHAPHGELHPLPIPEELWESIAIDFIVKLPQTPRKHDSILVVVDRLSKYAIFTPCSEKVDSEGLVRLLEEKVVACNGFPKSIVSDRDTRVTAKFFQEWCKKYSIEHKTTTAYHSRGNGQVERFNLTLENYLRSYVNTGMDDWDELLPVAQLAINSSHQESTGTTPFYLNHGRHAWMPGVTFKRAGLSGSENSEQRLQLRTAWKDAERIQALQKARGCLHAAQHKVKAQFSKGRKPMEFEVGQRVLLSVKNLRFKGLNCPKFMPRFIGPFTIEEKVGSVSYKLSLPPTMKVHPIFHAELLKEYKGDAVTPPHHYECEDGTVLYEVDRVADVHGHGHRRRYLIQWTGYGREFDSWEPRAQLLVDCPQLIEEFDAERDDKLRSKRRRVS